LLLQIISLVLIWYSWAIHSKVAKSRNLEEIADKVLFLANLDIKQNSYLYLFIKHRLKLIIAFCEITKQTKNLSHSRTVIITFFEYKL